VLESGRLLRRTALREVSGDRVVGVYVEEKGERFRRLRVFGDRQLLNESILRSRATWKLESTTARWSLGSIDKISDASKGLHWEHDST
jgi:hypothetical protein